MERDIHAELDALRGQVEALVGTVAALQGGAEEAARQPGRDAAADERTFPRAALWQATDHLARRAEELRASGLVAYSGCYAGADAREYRWLREQIAEDLLGQDDEMAARVLAALGNRQRLALLKAILQQPASAAELIDRLGLTSTGQAYHHLNTLAAAGLIRQAERGQFVFVGHQATAFLTLLAGVWEMLYSRYGTGTWDEGRESRAASGDTPQAGEAATSQPS